MKKREANFGLRFRHWIRANPLPYSCTFELKDCSHKKSFPFEEWKEAQRDWAMAIAGKGGMLMRQPGGSGHPDYTYHYNQPAFTVINFKEGFSIIDAKILLLEIKNSKKKSITFNRAKEIAYITIGR